MMCLATPADYRGELPPRCHLADGHTGPHQSGSGCVGMVRVESGEVWHDEPVPLPDQTTAAVSLWARLVGKGRAA